MAYFLWVQWGAWKAVFLRDFEPKGFLWTNKQQRTCHDLGWHNRSRLMNALRKEKGSRLSSPTNRRLQKHSPTVCVCIPLD
jgi:hypothetical protein